MEHDLCCSHLALNQNVLENVKKLLKSNLAKAEIITYQTGQVLYYQGHDPCGVYWVENGNCNLTHQSLINSKTTNYEANNEFLGLFHLIQNTPYCTSCTADETFKVYFFPKVMVQKWMGTYVKSGVRYTA